jgi:membrane protein implicated in regulation of membrane protease activity
MNWWNELTGLQQFFASVAIPASAVMIIQFILLLFGFSHSEGTDADIQADMEADNSLDIDSDDLSDGTEHSDGEAHEKADALRLFTLRSIIAFLSVGGWMGVVATGWRIPIPLVFILSLLAGWLALYFVAWSIRLALSLQQNGNIFIENAVGNTGEVYIPIPASKKGTGKISVLVQDRLSEFDAVTEEDRELKTGEEITVMGVSPQGVLVVAPKISPPDGVIIEKEL